MRGGKPMDLSLVLTCYNEEACLADSVGEIVRTLDLARMSYEIIFVDDASRDGTREAIRGIMASRPKVPMHAVYHERNTGWGGAVADGIRKASGDIVGFLDVDLEIHPRYIPACCEAIRQGAQVAAVERTFKFVWGGISRRFLSLGYAALVRLVLPVGGVASLSSGCKCFKRADILPVLETVEDTGWFWDMEMLVRCRLAGLSITRVPCLYVRNPRKRSAVRVVRDSLDVLAKLFALRRKLRGKAGGKMRHRGSLLQAVAVAAALSAAWIGISMDKPVHTDDPFFLYWARAIAPLPGEKPPLKYFNWLRYDEPMQVETQHYMPGWSMMLAAARHAVGERERPLHWLQWPFATMFLVGVFLLARLFGAPPWATLLVCATSPAFLLPVSGLLGDLPALGLGVLGLAVWFSSPTLAGRIAAALLLVLAAQMKQSVLVMYPLLVLDSGGLLTRSVRDWIIAAAALVLAGTYPDVAPHDPNRASIFGTVAWILQTSWNPSMMLMKLSYLPAVCGSLMIPVVSAAFAVLARRDPAKLSAKLRVLLAGGLAIPVLSAVGFWKNYPATLGFWVSDSGAGARLDPVPPTLNTLWFYLVIALFIAWAFLAFRPRKAGAPAWLNAWLLLAVAGFLLATWFPAVRHMLPIFPPLVMLYLIDLRKFCGKRAARAGVLVAVAANLWLGLSLARNDLLFARFCVDTASRGAKEAADRHLPLVTTASWGLRYYVERQGGRILEKSTEALPRGAVMLVPRLTDRRILPAALQKRSKVIWKMALPPSREMPLILPVQTIPPALSMGAFHGGYVWFPYAFSRSPSEEITALEIRPPSTGR